MLTAFDEPTIGLVVCEGPETGIALYINERAGTRNAFTRAMKNHGHSPSKSQHVRCYDGIDLPATSDRADFR